MRGVIMNIACIQPFCLPQNEAQKFLSHNGQSRGQNSLQTRKLLAIRAVCPKKISFGERNLAPFCRDYISRTLLLKRDQGKVYGSPPNVPIRQLELQDGEEEKGINKVEPESSEGLAQAEGVSKGFWNKLAPRFKLILTAAFAFVICNMDKVNMSVAIIPMSHQLGWNSTTAGLVQSSFFWGYTLSQLPGGWLAKRFSGQKVLWTGVLIWSVATAAVPTTAKFLPGLLLCRLLVGLGEGVSPSAATDLIARAMPVSERSRAVATVFGGLNVGSVIGLLLAPVVIERLGWQSVFYIFGLLGVVWCLLFDSAVGTVNLGRGAPASAVPDAKQELPGRSSNGASTNNNVDLRQRLTKEKPSNSTNGSVQHLASTSTSASEKVPWKAFFKSPAVWAMIYAHFCGNWGHYTLLAWLPTYFSEELHLDLTHAALVSIFPPLASVAVTSVAAPLADHLISRGYDITLVRKVCQSIAFLAPATCMTIASLTPKLNPWVDVAILTAGLGLSSFALAGLYCTHQDISPKYSSILLGITNTVGAIPGVLGVALVGIIFDRTHSWTLALFAPSIFFYLTGVVVWNVFASSKPQSFTS